MTPEQLQYILDWARSGNQLRYYNTIPSWCLHVTTRGQVEAGRHLDVFAMTIAKLADALEQANETAEYRERVLEYERGTCNSADISIMRANRKELLG